VTGQQAKPGTLRNRVQRLQRLGTAAAGQIAHWAEPQRRASFVQQAIRELTEAGSDVAAMLLDGSWRTPADDMDRRIDVLLHNKNLSEFGTDPFGFAPEAILGVVPALEFLYRVWFRVEAHGLERVPEGRCLLISNHSGQLPFDGAAIGAAMLLEREPPRMVRSMVEKFATGLPFFGQLCFRCGQVTGLPDNCRRLLEADECVLVFPEGARGIAKPFRERYRLTPFGPGFMRLALETNTPIVPVAVVGAEEQTINLMNLKGLATLFGAPSFPLTPLMPLLGPLAMLPAPVKYRVYFGEPLRFEGDPNDDEAVVAGKVAEVKSAIQRMIDQGLAQRRGILV
jgi:1-acyl-sn-glycerol-3-phosphate acyltransferase